MGLYETWSHPEVIIIGRSCATAHHILDTIATDLDDDRPGLDLNQTTTNLIPGAAFCFLEVDNRYYHDYVGFARWYYRSWYYRKRHFPLYQIIWPNNE